MFFLAIRLEIFFFLQSSSKLRFLAVLFDVLTHVLWTQVVKLTMQRDSPINFCEKCSIR